MKTIINRLLITIKFLLLIITFIGVMYLLFNMYQKLDKNIDLNFILIMIPFILLLILFFVNLTFKMQDVLDNMFYNSGCTLSLLSIVYLIYRTMCDKNMLYYYKDGNLNFTYFDEQINYIKIVLYLMIIINIILIVINYLSKKKKRLTVD